MPNEVTPSPSQNPVILKESNGGGEIQHDSEEETTPPFGHRKYVLEDFSQQPINRGQQEINYLITKVDEKIIDALKQVSSAVAKLASGGDVDLGPLDKAIKEVSEATKNVAGPFPPGCGPEK